MFSQSVRWFKGTAAIVAAAMLATGCAVGPDFLVPAAPAVSRYTKEPLTPHTSSTDVPGGQAQHFIEGRDVGKAWWRLFKSPALDALVERALDNNPTLQSAIATLRAANQAVYAQEGKFFPLVEANFNPTYQQTSAVLSPIPASGAQVFGLHTAQLQVSYTLDVWGLNRRTVESLQAQAENQRFQVEAAYLTLISNLVVAAITEASLRGQIDATRAIIKAEKKILDLLRKQLKYGYVTLGDVALQEAAVAQVVATLPPLLKALAQERDLISALVGTYPSEEPRQTFNLAELRLPTGLPVSVPSRLIQQRPDIRAAQAQLHAASAQIGVAIANILPNFTITGNVGYMSTTFANLLAPQNLFWLIGGTAAQTLFDGGTLLHELQQAKDTYNATAWSYRGTVVTAVQNVADSLRALQHDADALKAARDFERAAKISFDQAQTQLQQGYINQLVLLTVQATYLSATLQVVQARAARLADTAALFQALGGGWWNRTEPLPEKVLNVGTGKAQAVTEKARKDDFRRGLLFSPFQPD
jgi:NodT family efflux transporter outer membrane factor (OMF) lipoprotein